MSAANPASEIVSRRTSGSGAKLKSARPAGARSPAIAKVSARSGLPTSPAKASARQTPIPALPAWIAANRRRAFVSPSGSGAAVVSVFAIIRAPAAQCESRVHPRPGNLTKLESKTTSFVNLQGLAPSPLQPFLTITPRPHAIPDQRRQFGESSPGPLPQKMGIIFEKFESNLQRICSEREALVKQAFIANAPAPGIRRLSIKV